MGDQGHQWEQGLVAVGEELRSEMEEKVGGEGSFNGTVLLTEKADIFMEM